MIGKKEIEETVLSLAKRHVNKGTPVTMANKLIDDLQLEHDYIYLIIDLNRKYGQNIPPEAFESVRTISDLVDLYYLHLSA